VKNKWRIKEQKMANKKVLWGTIGPALVVGFVLAGCPDGGDNNPNNNNSSNNNSPPLTLPGRPGYVLNWYDEFNYTGSPDPAKWGYEHGLVRNNELQSYEEENASVGNGVLLIQGKKLPAADSDPGGQGNYTSASVITKGKKHFKFGVIQVRAKLPFDLGAWPAIWTLGATTPWWPVGGEVDIMELYRPGPSADWNTPLSLLANWCWKANGGDDWYSEWNTEEKSLDTWASAHSTTAGEWLSRFHVWELFWDETTMEISIDGEVVNTQASDISNPATTPTSEDPSDFIEHPFLEDQYLLLNLAIGGANGGTPDGQTDWSKMRYEIDYVRYYKKQ
jgi:beta-glucanase (GH16 family)